MDLQPLAFPAVVLVLVASIVIQIARSWRGIVIALAAQMAGVFMLVALPWPLEMAVVKLVAGWMACAVLALASAEGSNDSSHNWPETEAVWPSGRVFRIVAAVLVLLVVPSLAPSAVEWIPGISEEQIWAAFILIAMGLLHLGFTAHPLRVVAGLLTALSGFEIIYAAVESSTLVAGLLAASNLGLALIGAYLIIAPTIREGS
jgi:hypothetical protein